MEENNKSIFSNIDDVLSKFNYCSLGNSAYQDTYTIEDCITPERMYRHIQLNWHAVAGALKEYNHNDQITQLKIERKTIELENINKQIAEAEDDCVKRLKEIDKKEIELELSNLEITKKMVAPLVKDAINRLLLMEQRMKELESHGLRSFEESEKEYHKEKVLRDARAERIARELGIDKGTVEYANRIGADLSELLEPNSILSLIKNERFTLSRPLHDKQLAVIRNEEFIAKKNILIGIPKKGTDQVVGTNLDPNKFIYPHGSAWEVYFVHGCIWDEARNRIVEHAKEIGVDYLFFLDDDVLLPMNGLLTLYNTMNDYNVDIIGGYYYQKNAGKQPTWGVRADSGKHIVPKITPQTSELIYINWVMPAGALLIRMSVFDKIEKPYFNMIYEHNKIIVGEDCYFIRKCNEAGIKSYIHPEVFCGHISYQDNKIYWGNKIDDFKPGTLIQNEKEVKK